MGFTLTQTFSSSDNGILPTYTLDGGMPAWTAPPFINPSVSNGTSVSWFQGNETTKLPALDNLHFSIQRQVRQLDGSRMPGIAACWDPRLQSELLQYNEINPSYLNAFGSVAQSINVLNSLVGSATANAAGVYAPFPTFNSLWGSRATVAQALRPYPQYTYIDTYSGQGDHSGHSTYHAAIFQVQRRLSDGFVVQASYVVSKILTDSDSAWGGAGSGLGPGFETNMWDRQLSKSIGGYDVPRDFKFAGEYEVPFGQGKKYFTHGPAAYVFGGWRIASINLYDSGTPVYLSTSETLPIYPSGQSGYIPPYITSYTGWQPNWSGSFNPGKDNFFVPYGTGPFPLQGSGTSLYGIGNATRFNPKVRLFPNLNENMSVNKSFPLKGETKRLEFRAEAFNVFNRVRFGTGSTQLQSSTFGVLTGSGSQLNTPRQLQLALKFYY